MKASELKPGQQAKELYSAIEYFLKQIGYDKWKDNVERVVAMSDAVTGTLFDLGTLNFIDLANAIDGVDVTGWDDEPATYKLPNGFVPYDGSGKPSIGDDTLVEFCLRSDEGKPTDVTTVGELGWSWDDEDYSPGGDVIGYRVVKPAPPVAKPEPKNLPAIADAIESAAAAFHQKITPEPEQFAVGDWVVCVEVVDGLINGKMYQIKDVALPKVYVEIPGEWGWYFARRFRRATPAEIVKHKTEQGYCLTDDDTAAFRANKTDGWIDWHGAEYHEDGPCNSEEEMVKVRYRDNSEEQGEAIEFYWSHDGSGSDIVAYRLVNPPTPELTWTVIA